MSCAVPLRRRGPGLPRPSSQSQSLIHSQSKRSNLPSGPASSASTPSHNNSITSFFPPTSHSSSQFKIYDDGVEESNTIAGSGTVQALRPLSQSDLNVQANRAGSNGNLVQTQLGQFKKPVQSGPPAPVKHKKPHELTIDLSESPMPGRIIPLSSPDLTPVNKFHLEDDGAPMESTQQELMPTQILQPSPRISPLPSPAYQPSMPPPFNRAPSLNSFKPVMIQRTASSGSNTPNPAFGHSLMIGSQPNPTHAWPHPNISINTNVDSLPMSPYEDYCTPINQGVKERSDSKLTEELLQNRLERQLSAQEKQLLNNAAMAGKHQQHLTALQTMTGDVAVHSASAQHFLFNHHQPNKKYRTTQGDSFSMVDLNATLPSADAESEPNAITNPFLKPEPAINNKSRKRGPQDAAPQQPYSRFSSDFEYIRQLGSGAYGDVMQVRHRLDGCLYAVKRIKRLAGAKHMKQKYQLLHEVFGLSAALSTQPAPPSIVRYHSCWFEDRQLYIQTEFCNGGSLTQRLKERMRPFSEPELLELAHQMGKALMFLHEACGLVHMDIKPDNILEASTGVFKLSDFGLCASIAPDALGGQFSVSAIGDRRYMPQEAVENEDHLSNPDTVDIFSLGMSLFELASNEPLTNSAMELDKIRNGNLAAIEGKVSPFFYELVRRLIQSDPSQRLTARQLVEAIEAQRANETIRKLKSELDEKDALIRRLQSMLGDRSVVKLEMEH